MVDQPPSEVLSALDLPSLFALQQEVIALRERLDAQEKLLQLRDALPAPSPVAELRYPTPLELPSHWEIDAEQSLQGACNFHGLEWGEEGAFRWTGPGAEAGFDLWIDRRYPLRARLEIADFGHEANKGALSLIVDGSLYPLQQRGPGKWLMAGPILPRATAGPTQLLIRVPHLHAPPAPSHHAPPLRGIAFKRLSLSPPP